MKRTTQIFGASLLALAVLGLGGCFGNGGDDTAMTPTQPPPEEPAPAPEPETTSFHELVVAQFASDRRDSETATPVEVNGKELTFTDDPNSDAYDCLFTDAGCDSN